MGAMSLRSTISIAAVAALSAFMPLGCSSDDDDDDCQEDVVKTSVDPDADFDSYTTFAVLTEEAYPVDTPDDVKLNLTTAINAATDELVALGLEEVDVDADPDVVLFTLSKTDEEDAIYWQCRGGWYGYWGWVVWDPCAWLEPIYVEYTVGSLVVGLADPSEEKVVFGGVTQTILECGGDVTQHIESAVDAIFDDYPQ